MLSTSEHFAPRPPPVLKPMAIDFFAAVVCRLLLFNISVTFFDDNTKAQLGISSCRCVFTANLRHLWVACRLPRVYRRWQGFL